MKKKIGFAVIAVSLLLLVLGLLSGEYSAVLEKARSICLSCIGIG